MAWRPDSNTHLAAGIGRERPYDEARALSGTVEGGAANKL